MHVCSLAYMILTRRRIACTVYEQILVCREAQGLRSRNESLAEEREALLARMDDSAQPIVQQMDKVVQKLREDFNRKVDEVLKLRDECMIMQVLDFVTLSALTHALLLFAPIR